MPGAARIGDLSKCDADMHGCPICPHVVQGPAVTGSPNVSINGRPAVRVGDKGIHAVCCGPNTWNATMGSSTVLINNKPAHRKDDMDMHCGGVGKMIQGSDDVIIGG